MTTEAKTITNQSGSLLSDQSIAAMTAQTEVVRRAMATLMTEDIHYGRVPGFGKKPTLLKPGAEVLLKLFGISAEPEVEDFSTVHEIRCRVIVTGRYPDGSYAGGGVGECSTGEERMKWRKATCDAEFEASPPDRRRVKWAKSRFDGGAAFQVKQVRIEPADQANTVLKIAKKRALVDMCLTATAASDLFTQDVEDLATLNLASDDSPPAVPAANAKEVEQDTESGVEPDRDDVVVDSIERIATKELDNGGTKYGIKTRGRDWFSTFNQEHAQIADFARRNSIRVQIGFAANGPFKNVTSLELLERTA